MMDPERHLGTDLHWQPRQVVERVGDPTIRRVFQRHDAIVGVAGVHLFEGCRDAPHRHEFHGTAKTVEGGQVAVGPRRAQMGDAKVLLDRTGARDQLPPDCLEALARKRSRTRGHHSLQHQLLAGRVVGDLTARLLQVANLPSQLGPFVHEADQFPVDLVDLRPQTCETSGPRGLRRRLPLRARLSHARSPRHVGSGTCRKPRTPKWQASAPGQAARCRKSPTVPSTGAA